jgi:LysM domain
VLSTKAMVKFRNPWGEGGDIENSVNKGLKEHLLDFGKNVLIQNDKLLYSLSLMGDKSQRNKWLKYTVKGGDSFQKIINRFCLNIDADDLAYWNDLDSSDPSQPHTGTKLFLPFKEEKDIVEIEKKLNEMTQEAKIKKWNVAVDNLERYRKGKGGVKQGHL